LWTGLLTASVIITDPAELHTPTEKTLLNHIAEKTRRLEAEPNNKAILKELAFYYYRLKRYEKSSLYLERAYRIDKKDEKLAKDLLVCYLQSNDIEKADKLCDEALSLNQKNQKILFYKGIIHLERNEFGKALDIFQNISDVSLKSLPSFYINLGRCYYQLNEDNKAKETFLKSLKIDRNNIFALRYLKILSGGDFYKTTRKRSYN
jgi:tetratricopeptide (TPR) repeat protein